MKPNSTSSYKVYANITSSIAFLPTIIATGFILLAIGILYFETTAFSTFLEKRLPFMLAKEEENARLILNIVASGTISLTVFSFSMVMIGLSQASSDLSPRVIPRLATDKGHQVVLGFYIGTIVYSLILLLNFQKEAAGVKATPAIAVLISLICGVLCILLFVYFIHSISKTIQVDHVLNHIFMKAYQALELEKNESVKFKRESNGQEIGETHPIKSTRSGYVKLIELQKLLLLATKHNFQIFTIADVGSFVVEGVPIMEINTRKKPDKQLLDELENCYMLSLDEVVMEDFEQGVKQISEIAVKALSPGINDPATAIKGIDFLTLLFVRRLKIKTNNSLYDDKEKLRVTEKIVSVHELLSRYVTPIRTYGRGDIQINLRLLKCMQALLLTEGQSRQLSQELMQHVKAIMYDADKHIDNLIDRSIINEALQKLNNQLPQELNLAAPMDA